MGKEVDTKFTWVIKNFSSLESKKIYSDVFVVDGCKWYLSLYLDVPGSESLPSGWKRHATMKISVVNQVYPGFSLAKETQHCFDSRASDWGFKSMVPLKLLHARKRKFLVNGEVKIVAEVKVLEVIGKLDVADESEEATKPLSKLEPDDRAESSDFLEEASLVKEAVEVNGFQVLPSQVESVSRIFERHPEFASKFRLKNHHLKSPYINVLLGVIEMLCQSTQELSQDDLEDAAASLEYLTNAGFALDWLEEKLGEVSDKKRNEEASEIRMKEIEEELKDLKLKRSNLEAELEKEKADVSVARAPLSFDDVV